MKQKGFSPRRAGAKTRGKHKRARNQRIPDHRSPPPQPVIASGEYRDIPAAIKDAIGGARRL